jgi:subtilisin-like proprotein convertase family protein
MKKTFFNQIFCPILFGFYTINAQTPAQQKKIIDQYSPNAIEALQIELQQQQQVFLNQLKNVPTDKQQRENRDGTFDQLIGFLPDGTPLFYSIQNINAAKTTRANTLNSGGILGLQLDGQNMIGGVWDGGPTRTSHQEFQGRAITTDGNTTLNLNSSHATHVSGTVGAGGVDADAKGMAPFSTIRTFEWTNDLTEVSQQAAQGLLLSNHSYGTPAASVPTWFIGAYSSVSRTWDQISHTYPYYLMVTAAGNEGNFNNVDATTPGFDKLTGNKTAKNNLVVANAQDANVDVNGNLVSVLINSGSSQGPADDLRIKPDITGNGTGVFSSTASSNTSYSSFSGTSMASPNVMGTLLLVQQHYQNVNQSFMKAATLKGLACHTADDTGLQGPDATFGWGLLNAKRAAETITNNGISSWISEEVLPQNASFSKTVKSINGQSLIASITWTDVPGVANNGILNDPTPGLVNDLDIRITQGNQTFYPWRLRSDATLPALRDGDNVVDNVEQVKIDASNGGEYTITVTHKGTLVGGIQPYSLVITGIESSFRILPLANNLIYCSSDLAMIPIDFKRVGGPSVQLSATNLPSGLSINFSQNNLTNDGIIQANLINLNQVAPGNYSFQLHATNGLETETRTIFFRVFSENFQPIQPIAPANGQNGIAISTVLQWQNDVNVEDYQVQVSTNPNFSNIFAETSTANTKWLLTGLQPTTVYYWRILPSNRCTISTQAPVYTFMTGQNNCNLTYTATDFSNATIASTPNAIATVPIVIPDNFMIGDMNVVLNIAHTYVQDMTITLEGPSGINTPVVVLLEEPCGSQDDINATLDDAGGPLTCGTNPAISGTIQPKQALSALNSLQAQGTWVLRVVDPYNQDGGQINQVTLQCCSLTTPANNLNFSKNTIVANINSTKVLLPTELLATTVNESPEVQLYTLLQLPSLGTLQKNNVPLTIGATFTQSDIASGNITFVNTQAVAASDQFKVNISNQSNGWISNEILLIDIQDPLGIDEVVSTKEIWLPNPTNGNIQWFGNPTEQILVLDMQGRVVVQKTNLTNLNLQMLQDGVYWIKTQTNQVWHTQKVVLKK